MTTKVCFDEICRDALNCEHYTEWELEVDLSEPNRPYFSSMPCVSCQLVGQSYNIEEYPFNCPHKEILMKHAIAREIAIAKFEHEIEQGKIWRRLNDKGNN